MAKKSSKSKGKRSSKPKAKKSSKPKTRMSSKLKVKKGGKPKRVAMAKKSSRPKANIIAIAGRFTGTYNSTVDTVSTMNGTLVVPDPNNSNNVLYTVSADGTSYSVTPTFSGNLISFSFVKNGVTYSYSATSWTPSRSPSGGEWNGTGSGPGLTEQEGSWKAKT